MADCTSTPSRVPLVVCRLAWSKGVGGGGGDMYVSVENVAIYHNIGRMAIYHIIGDISAWEMWQSITISAW